MAHNKPQYKYPYTGDSYTARGQNGHTLQFSQAIELVWQCLLFGCPSLFYTPAAARWILSKYQSESITQNQTDAVTYRDLSMYVCTCACTHVRMRGRKREGGREREHRLVLSELEIEIQISFQSVLFLECSKVLVILVILSKSHENILNPLL